MRRLLLSATNSTIKFYSTSSKIRVPKSTVNASSYSSAYLLLKEFQYIKSRLFTRPTAVNAPTDQPLKSIITTTTSTRTAKISKDTFDFDRIDVKLFNFPFILNLHYSLLF